MFHIGVHCFDRRLIGLTDYKIVTPDPVSNALALFRLQDTYALKTKDMAKGNLSSDYSEKEALTMTGNAFLSDQPLNFENSVFSKLLTASSLVKLPMISILPIITTHCCGFKRPTTDCRLRKVQLLMRKNC